MWKVTVTWRGAAGLKAELTETVSDLARVSGIIAGEGPAGWAMAYVTVETMASNAWRDEWRKAEAAALLRHDTREAA